MLYLLLKSIHIIFMVSYFAGIFYLVRIFVYYKDTEKLTDLTKSTILREQYIFMSVRLWNIIIVPAFTIMLLSGLGLIFVHYPYFPLLSTDPLSWFYIKILFLLSLFSYHYWCYKKTKELKNGNLKDLKEENTRLRMWNEIGTLILFAVVFTVIFKTAIFTFWWQLIVGFIIFIVLIMGIVKLVNAKKK